MTNILQDKIIDTHEAASGIRNLHELFAAQSGFAKRRGMLFDEFWREGELAVLIGEPGVGKSLFAVGTADALACGRKFSGLKTPAEPLRVLYIDLVLSDAQFAARYSTRCETGEATFYKFAENFSYAKPPQETQDVEVWLFELLSKCEFDAAVIDDLSMLASMEKGSQEALRLMAGLRRVARARGVSLLVLADSERTACGRFSAESGLGARRRILNYADSVFAISARLKASDRREIVQLRTRSGELFWNERRPLRAVLSRNEDGLFAFEFDTLEMDEERRDEICRIKELHDDERLTFREIADELGISKSSAQRAYALWRPGLEDDDEDDAFFTAKKEACEEELCDASIDPELGIDRRYLADENEEADEQMFDDNAGDEPYDATPAKREPLPERPETWGDYIARLPTDIDGYGRVRYIEERPTPSGKPTVYYTIGRDNVVSRKVHGLWGPTIYRLANIDDTVSIRGPLLT